MLPRLARTGSTPLCVARRLDTAGPLADRHLCHIPPGCEPTGHAYSAAISACAAAGDWRRAVALFDEMTGPGAIRPDVVSCTALITALAAGGEADRSEAVVAWMLGNGVRPNARTYTALMAALGNAKRWGRAVEVLALMQTPEWGGVQPNAYTYSALLKVRALGTGRMQ
jgi:pentatricopeptide repeat protein